MTLAAGGAPRSQGVTTFSHPWMPGVPEGDTPDAILHISVNPVSDAAKLAVFNAYVVWSMVFDPQPFRNVMQYATLLLANTGKIKDVYADAVKADETRGGAPACAVRDHVRFLELAAEALLPPDSPQRKRMRLALRMWYSH